MPLPSVNEIISDERGMVDLWCYFPESSPDPELLSAQAALMTPDERERCGRFRLERDRRIFVATRALIRTVLSSYFPVAPADWRFLARHGKPFVASPIPAPGIHFNLAHTAGLVACAVTAAHDSIGVDTEMIRSEPDLLGEAERYFSSPERRALRACPASRQPRLFFSYWTLKESYVKARGEGLRLPLDRFSFHFEEDTIRIILDPCLSDDAANWRFALLDATPNHLIAVAAKTGGAPLTLRIKQTVPLGRTLEGEDLIAISGLDLPQ